MNCPRCDKPIDEHEAGPETDACVVVVVFDREECPVHQSLWCCSRGKAQYSQKIADAWKVVEKIAPMTLEDSGDGWSIWRTSLDGFGYYAEGETAMLAICRAALKAVTNDDY